MRLLSHGVAATAVAAAAMVAGTGVAQAAATVHSGSAIYVYAGDQVGLCTLSAVVEKDGVHYGVTAGHCMQDGAVDTIKDYSGEVIATKADIDAGTFVFDEQGDNVNDFAYFRLAEGTAIDNRVYSHTTTGVHSLDTALDTISEFYALPLGEPVPVTPDLKGRIVCKDGAMTSRTCGIVTDVNPETGRIDAVIPAVLGDSGGSLHVAGPDGRRHIVGGLSYGSPVLFNVFDGTYQHLQANGLRG